MGPYNKYEEFALILQFYELGNSRLINKLNVEFLSHT